VHLYERVDCGVEAGHPHVVHVARRQRGRDELAHYIEVQHADWPARHDDRGVLGGEVSEAGEVVARAVLSSPSIRTSVDGHGGDDAIPVALRLDGEEGALRAEQLRLGEVGADVEGELCDQVAVDA